MKRLLVSHTDLDGIGCIVLAKYYNHILKFDEMLSKDYDFELVSENFEYLKNFEEIIITDLSIKEEKTRELENFGIKVLFFDHHESASWLEKENDSESVYSLESCGTKLFWENYIKPRVKRYKKQIDTFVEMVDTYDLWQRDKDWENAKNLQNVLYGYKNFNEKDNLKSCEPFFEHMFNNFKYFDEWKWTRKDLEIINRANKREQELFDKAMKNISIRIDEKNKLFGVISLPSKISLVCSRVLDAEPNLDYLVCFNTYGGLNGKISFRSRDPFNCNDIGIANGHNCAAGAQISIDNSFKILEDTTYIFRYNEDCIDNNEKSYFLKVE